MYVAYVDESGFVGQTRNPDQPVQVMACIMPSDHNLHRTSREFSEIIGILRDHDVPLDEQKAEQVYGGRGPWARVPGDARHGLFEAYLQWVSRRPHAILLSVIDNERFFRLREDGNPIASELGAPYVAGALQIALAIQRLNQGKPGNKGKTILILDKQSQFQRPVEDLLADPPGFTDPFYRCDDPTKRLDQLLDTAYFVDSRYSYFVQAADTVAFVSRLVIEMESYDRGESYTGEAERVSAWFNTIRRRLKPASCLCPRGREDIKCFYRELFPAAWTW